MNSTPLRSDRQAEPADFGLVVIVWSLCVLTFGMVMGWILAAAVTR